MTLADATTIPAVLASFTAIALALIGLAGIWLQLRAGKRAVAAVAGEVDAVAAEVGEVHSVVAAASDTQDRQTKEQLRVIEALYAHIATDPGGRPLAGVLEEAVANVTARPTSSRTRAGDQ